MTPTQQQHVHEEQPHVPKREHVAEEAQLRPRHGQQLLSLGGSPGSGVEVHQF